MNHMIFSLWLTTAVGGVNYSRSRMKSYQLQVLSMGLKLAIVFLLATRIHGGLVPAQSEFTPADFNTVKTVNTATVVSSLVSGINVLISLMSFFIPPSNTKGRIVVLMTSLLVNMSIVTNTLINASVETIKVTQPRNHGCTLFYRVTHHLVSYLSSTSKQKLHFSTESIN